MTRSLVLAAALAAAAASPALGQARPTKAEAALGARLKQWPELVNDGKIDQALAYFVPNPTIVEDLAPYRWTGPTAGKAWIDGMAANTERAGMSAVAMHFSDPAMVQIAGRHAYAVMPGALTYSFKDGKVAHAHGHAILTLQKLGASWRIETMAWGWERP